jgi:hypothetical protein
MTIQSTFVRSVGLVAMLVIASALWIQEPAQSQPNGPSQGGDAAQQPEGVEVLAHGPVHEAYAEPANVQTKATPVVAKQPPEPIEEMPPDQKPDGDNVQWLPGYWAFEEEKSDYMWVSGFWRVPPPGRQWVPGHWKQVDGGWQWAPGFWGAQEQQEVTYLPPPPEPLEVAPPVPAPNPDHVYVRGCWVYRDGHYVWRPGFWSPCRPGWVWVPAHYVWAPCGYVYVEGYWDYTLRERGVLFAPAYIDVRVCCRPGWVYSPCYVVHDEALYGALFVRPGCGCYYFGDYFGASYRSSGYVAWCDVRVGGGDPLFAYYSVHYRSDPGWSISIRANYAGCYAGTIAPPPRTLIQQTTIVQNTTINNFNSTTVNNNTTNNVTKNVNVTNNNVTNNNTTNNVRNTSMVTSLSQASKSGMNLKPVSQQERLTAKASAQQVVQASQQRSQQESKLLAQGPPPTKSTDAPRSAKLDLPKQPAAANSAVTKAPPPALTGASHTANTNQGSHATGTQPANNATPGHPAVNQTNNAGHVNQPVPNQHQPANAGTGTPAPPPNANHTGAVPPPPGHTGAVPPPPGGSSGNHAPPANNKQGPPPKTVPPSGKSAPPDHKKDKDDKSHN